MKCRRGCPRPNATSVMTVAMPNRVRTRTKPSKAVSVRWRTSPRLCWHPRQSDGEKLPEPKAEKRRRARVADVNRCTSLLCRRVIAPQARPMPHEGKKHMGDIIPNNLHKKFHYLPITSHRPHPLPFSPLHYPFHSHFHFHLHISIRSESKKVWVTLSGQRGIKPVMRFEQVLQSPRPFLNFNDFH